MPIVEAFVARIAVAATVVTVVVLGWAGVASAEIEVSVDSPSGNQYRPAAPLFLVVEISSDRAVDGTITIEDTNRGGDLAQQSFEAPGGSSKQIVVRVPLMRGGIRVVVETSDGQVRRLTPSFSEVGAQQPVGLSPGLVSPSNPVQVPMAFDDGDGVLLPFDPALLAHGPDVLAVHNALMMTEADYESLSETLAEALHHWVAYGGVLFIDASPGRPPAGLPVGFGGGDRAPHGVGFIELTDGRMASGDFDGLIVRRNLAAASVDGRLPTGGLDQLIHDAVIRTLPVGPLVALLALYVLAIGPVGWFVLRRSNRLPLIWVAVPVVALATTGLIWAVGSALRGSSAGAHATLVADFAGTSEVYSQYLVTAPGGGFTGVRLDDGWVQSAVFQASYDPYTGDDIRQPIRRGDDLGVDLTPGSATAVGARRVGAGDRSWRIEAETRERVTTGTATNLTDHRLHRVLIATPSGIQEVASVGAGETIDFRVEASNAGPLNTHAIMIDALADHADVGEEASPGLYRQWAGSVPHSGDRFVVAMGWTTDVDGPLRSTAGDSFGRGRTGFTSMVAVDATVGDGADPRRVGRAEVIEEAWYTENQLVDANGQQFYDTHLTYVVELDPDAPPDLAIEFPAGFAAADLWDGEQWVASGLGGARAGGNPDTVVAVALPADAVIDGAVRLRAGAVAIWPSAGGSGSPYLEPSPDSSMLRPSPVVRRAEPGEMFPKEIGL